ncbi:MAG: formate dehydrogenase subunit gamma [Hyphomicrobiaceae bacterium]
MTIETSTGAPLKVRRYSGAARINHWITAISFVLLWLSGLALFHPSLYGLSALFGGGSTMRWLHPWIGVVLSVSFLGLFLRFFAANLPEGTDLKWLANIRSVLAGHEEYLPEIGKYNAGQKMVFWSMSLLIPLMLISGIGLWDAGLAFVGSTFGFKPTIDMQRWAAVVHASAGIATIVIWIVHVYAAIWVRGTISAMTKGNVTGGWAWRHHRKWLRKEVAEHKVS